MPEDHVQLNPIYILGEFILREDNMVVDSHSPFLFFSLANFYVACQYHLLPL